MVCVDLLGPWTVKNPSGKKHLKAFKAIYPFNGWFELASNPDKYDDTAMDTFHNCWITRGTHYPQPTQVTFDN
jgi:hypothetical protein